jgi:hypothetical protein
MNGFNNLPCLTVKVDHPGMNVTIGKYAEASLGADSSEYCGLLRLSPSTDQPAYPVTYFVQKGFIGTPTLDMEIAYTC